MLIIPNMMICSNGSEVNLIQRNLMLKASIES